MNHSPERQLWCAVIGRALQDALSRVSAVGSTTEQERLRDDARRWITQNDGDFRRACEAAGYDPDFLRDHLMRLTAPANGKRHNGRKSAPPSKSSSKSQSPSPRVVAGLAFRQG